MVVGDALYRKNHVTSCLITKLVVTNAVAKFAYCFLAELSSHFFFIAVVFCSTCCSGGTCQYCGFTLVGLAQLIPREKKWGSVEAAISFGVSGKVEYQF